MMMPLTHVAISIVIKTGLASEPFTSSLSNSYLMSAFISFPKGVKLSLSPLFWYGSDPSSCVAASEASVLVYFISDDVVSPILRAPAYEAIRTARRMFLSILKI